MKYLMEWIQIYPNTLIDQYLRDADTDISDFQDPINGPLERDQLSLDSSYQPQIKDKDYPKDKNNRHFSNDWYSLDGQSIKWLEYSVALDKMFCYFCRQFKDLLEGRAYANKFALG